MSPSFEHGLERYARLALEVGLNVQPGQHVLLAYGGDMTAPSGVDFVRLLTGHAYRMGARSVQVQWTDETLSLLRYQHAPRETLGEFWEARKQLYLEAVERGAAYLHISASDPQAFAGVDPEVMLEAGKPFREAVRPFREAQHDGRIPWCIIDFPTPVWARRVFPDLAPHEALERLWSLVFAANRLGEGDPVARWRAHSAELSARAAWLTAQGFAALHFQGGGTDLRVGLVPGHVWIGGGATSSAGVDFIPNLPTEEVFTAPHREQTEGTVRGSKAVSIFGQLVSGWSLEFEAGRVVRHSAQTGQDALSALLGSDEGSSRLGEVALVPHSSPISQTGVLFQSILFDENAACHIALGSHYPDTLTDGLTLSEAERSALGANLSELHLDLMIGSSEVDVYGLREDGQRVALLEGGEWGFALVPTV